MKKNDFKTGEFLKGIIIIFAFLLIFGCSLGNETVGNELDADSEIGDLDLSGYIPLTRASGSYIQPLVPGSMVLTSSQSFTVITDKQIYRVVWSYSSGLKAVYGGLDFIALQATTVGSKYVQGIVLYKDNTYEILRYEFKVITMIQGNPGELYLGDTIKLTADVESGFSYKWTLSSGLQGVYGGTYPDYTFTAFRGVTAGTRTVKLTRTHTATGRYVTETATIIVYTTKYYIAETWKDDPNYNYGIEYTIAEPSRTQISRTGWSWHHWDVINDTNKTTYDDIYLLVKNTETGYNVLVVRGESQNRPIIGKDIIVGF